MLSELRKHPRALFISLAFHAVVIVAMIVNLQFVDKPTKIKAGQVAKTVQAEVIDSKQLEDRKKQEQQEVKRKQEAEKKKKDLAAKKKKDRRSQARLCTVRRA